MSSHLLRAGCRCNQEGLHACRGEPGGEARKKCPHVIAPHVHEQYRECENLHADNYKLIFDNQAHMYSMYVS